MDLKPKDLADMKWLKEECLECDCFRVDGCDQCEYCDPITQECSSINWPLGQCPEEECVLVRLERKFCLARDKAEALEEQERLKVGQRAIHLLREVIPAVGEPGCWWCPGCEMWLPFSRVTEDNRCDECATFLAFHNGDWAERVRAVLADYDKAVGRDA
jgi:hypothetical protein